MREGQDNPRTILRTGLVAGTLAAAAAAGDVRHWRSVAYTGAALALGCGVVLAVRTVSRWAAHMALGDPLTAQRALRLAAQDHEQIREIKRDVHAMRRDMAQTIVTAGLGPDAEVTRPRVKLHAVGDDAG